MRVVSGVEVVHKGQFPIGRLHELKISGTRFHQVCLTPYFMFPHRPLEQRDVQPLLQFRTPDNLR